MRRAAIERARALRVWKDHNRIIHGNEDDTGCICDKQPNRFRKGQKRGGCGKPRCYMCHGDKLLGIRTVKQRQADERFSSSVQDQL
jgi:hypothetical protein